MKAAIVAVALLGSSCSARSSGAGTSLNPVQAVLLPDGASANNPLAHVGANGPWHIESGEDLTGISSEVPEGCQVDQAAYVSRHGSRYPDQGAHNGWLEMARRFRESKYTATGPLSFIHTWESPLTNPEIQIAQLSKTGYKELYPDLYQEGEDFVVWANNYTRVLQTAQLFLHGFLGTNSSLGTVVSVTGKGFPSHLGDTLAPSDMCPAFVDDSSKQQDEWRQRWLPAFKKRLSKYIKGDLQLDDSTWNDFPYICGFESQITGKLSPFCDTFTQKELEAYEYQQDLRYYYGVGPATKVASKMMVPFLESLIERFVAGPDATGKNFDGTPFKLPKILMSFLNDGQLNELAVATGVFDKQAPLPLDRIPKDRIWRSSNISPMKGAIAFERLSCSTNKGYGSKKFVRILVNDIVYPVPSCQDGPGKSCSLAKYSKFTKDRLRKNGNFAKLCNATDPATPSKVLGASFFTNLAQSHLQAVKP
ncbi:3-phytase B [Fusarium circinatum]|uniref:3-phytase n=1 Tax=Fusarium circinatum TaxID=48490 RepID=A0A8H5T160_FUSCI|nr:3-phytase B [Fusarium circinatum]